MKKIFFLFFLGMTSFAFSQKNVHKKIMSIANQIEISTTGLDNISIQNSKSGFVEVFLFDEMDSHSYIDIEESGDILKIGFQIRWKENEDVVFRKFITKRLNRANAIIKIPKGIALTVFGGNIDIESKNYQGDLSVFIEKGDLKMYEVQKKMSIKLYAGTIYAFLKNSNIDIVSSRGNIIIDGKNVLQTYQKKTIKNIRAFKVESIKANIIVTTL